MQKSESDLILAINSGSSSLKFGLFRQENGEETIVLRGAAEGVGKSSGKLRIIDANAKILHDESYTLPTQAHALSEIVGAATKFSSAAPACVGHRVVHGGPHLLEHQLITDDLLKKLKAASHFAPLHIPAALTLIHEARRLLPHVDHYACFDTAFHANMPETSRRFALPDETFQKGIQRYGFHGLSYESILHRLRDRIPERMICAHLGSGASLVALRHGSSIDTSMGLTPTGGVPMSTRSGDLDPGVLLFLMRTEKLEVDALEQFLNHNAGLVALSGGEADMQQLQASAESGDRKAALAIEIFSAAVRKYVGAYAAELGGIDLLVFSGGIGEHSAYVRDHICRRLEFLGIKALASGGHSKVEVIRSEEEEQIARHCRRLMRSAAQKSEISTAERS